MVVRTRCSHHPLLGPLGLRGPGMKPAVGQVMMVRTYFFGCVSFLTLVLGSSAALAEKREGHASAALLAGYGTTNDENEVRSPVPGVSQLAGSLPRSTDFPGFSRISPVT